MEGKTLHMVIVISCRLCLAFYPPLSRQTKLQLKLIGKHNLKKISSP